MADPFEERLRAALHLEAQRLAAPVDPERLFAAAAGLPPSPLRRPWLVGAVAGVIVVAALAALVTLAPAARPGGIPGASDAVVVAASAPASPPASPGPITLDDCQITPVSAPLAFQGWATLAVLDVSGGGADPGQPVYALVTRDLAEWVGWRTPDTTPIYPQPIGRMGCIYDPSTGRISEIGIPMDWQPPQLVDGCPASAEDEYAGYREIGGPRAWALLPAGTSWWISNNRFLILVRLDPPPAADEVITAWAQPLTGGPRVDAVVGDGSASLPQGGLRSPGDAAAATYSIVEQRFPAPGCWVLNVAVNGELAGSAIVPVSVIPGAAPGTPAASAGR